MQLYKDPPIINVSRVQFLTFMECTVSNPGMQDDSIWQIKNVDAIVIRETNVIFNIWESFISTLILVSVQVSYMHIKPAFLISCDNPSTK